VQGASLHRPVVVLQPYSQLSVAAALFRQPVLVLPSSEHFQTIVEPALQLFSLTSTQAPVSLLQPLTQVRLLIFLSELQ